MATIFLDLFYDHGKNAITSLLIDELHSKFIRRFVIIIFTIPFNKIADSFIDSLQTASKSQVSRNHGLRQRVGHNPGDGPDQNLKCIIFIS